MFQWAMLRRERGYAPMQDVVMQVDSGLVHVRTSILARICINMLEPQAFHKA